MAVALVVPTYRAIRWLPILAGAAVSLLIVAIPAASTARLGTNDLATLLRFAAVAGAITSAFVLDDPAASSTVVLPGSRLLRHVVRVAVILPLTAGTWAGAVAITRGGAPVDVRDSLPLGQLTLEAAALWAVAVALAAARLRATHGETGGAFAAPALLALTAAAALLPDRVALFVAPTEARAR